MIFSITSMLKVVNLSLCVWGLLACKTFLKTELFHTETLRSVFTLAVHDEGDPDWIPESPSKLQEAGKGQIYVPTRKKKVTWENEWNMFDIFVVVSEKILQEPKKIICKWCFFSH